MSARTFTVKDRTRQYHKSRVVKPIVPLNNRELTSKAYFALKWLAIALMVVWLTYVFIDKNIQNPHPEDTSLAVGVYGESGVYLNQVEIVPTPVKIILSVLGRLSFPLFSFLLVECYNHTPNKKRHLARLLVIAVLSEVPWDYIHSGELWDIESQNVAFTLALGFAMLILYDLPYRDYLKQYKPKIANDEKKLKRNEKYIKVAITGAATAIALLLKCDFDWSGILLIALLALSRSSEHRIKWTVTSFVAFILAQSSNSVVSLGVLVLIPVVLIPLASDNQTKRKNIKSFAEKPWMQLAARCSYTALLMALCVGKIVAELLIEG